MVILGLHPIGHDTSAAIIDNGKVLFAIEEERLSKEKHSTKFPFKAIQKCLDETKMNISDIDIISLSGDYSLQAKNRYLEFWNKYYPSNIHRILDEIDVFKNNINLVTFIRENLNFSKEIFQCHHHSAHFASSFYTSKFEESSLYSIDGVGDYESSVSGYGKLNNIEIFEDMSVTYPISMGLLYTAITSYLGFIPHCDEGKVMGLAPYGNKKKYEKKFHKIINFIENGKIDFDLSYLSYPFKRGTGVSNKFIEIFGKPRKKNDVISQRLKDIAATLQFFTEETLIHGLKSLELKTNSNNLCLAGGVALNCVANGKIFERTNFKNINIQPASGDNGTSLGSALYRYYHNKKYNGKNDRIPNSVYLGTQFSNQEIKSALLQKDLKFTYYEDASPETAKLLNKGNIIAWFNGKMEFGPRALGNRSILTAPFPGDMKDILNHRVKKRESFRPFAPSVMEEHADDFFEIYHASPHMLLASRVRDKAVSKVPAITHVDQTARVQTVNEEENKVYYNLINEFYKISNIPLLLNTSFNKMGQPICHDIHDAITTFLENDIDYLVFNNKFIIKNNIK